MQEKLRAWGRGPQSSAIFGASGWALSISILGELWRWELKFLRRVFNMRWHKGGCSRYMYVYCAHTTHQHGGREFFKSVPAASRCSAHARADQDK
eukprot:8597930-Pyramimonas_sp.AAC.1